MKQHRYEVQVDWTGNKGEGTKKLLELSPRSQHSRAGESADPGVQRHEFSRRPVSLQSPGNYWYPAFPRVTCFGICIFAAVNHVIAQEYHDAAFGVMRENEDGSGGFVQVDLKPVVKILPDSDREKAVVLHHDAHRLCFIARSVNFRSKSRQR